MDPMDPKKGSCFYSYHSRLALVNACQYFQEGFLWNLIDRDRKMLRENGLIVTKIDLMRTKQLKKHLLMLLHVFCAGHRMNHQVSLLNREATQGEHKRFRSMREVFHPMHRTKTCTIRGHPLPLMPVKKRKRNSIQPWIRSTGWLWL